MKKIKAVEKNELKVYVTMHNNARLMGSFYLSADERLQDLMNDERKFLPLYTVGNNKQAVVMISKRYIEKVEELQGDSIPKMTSLDRRTGIDRRSTGDRRTHSVSLQVAPVSTDEDKDSDP